MTSHFGGDSDLLLQPRTLAQRNKIKRSRWRSQKSVPNTNPSKRKTQVACCRCLRRCLQLFNFWALMGFVCNMLKPRTRSLVVLCAVAKALPNRCSDRPAPYLQRQVTAMTAMTSTRLEHCWNQVAREQCPHSGCLKTRPGAINSYMAPCHIGELLCMPCGRSESKMI